MTGVGVAPASSARLRQASWSSIAEAHATWWSAPAPRVRVLEERDVRARAALLVRVEEVVDGRVVLVHRLLDEPQAEDAGIEVDVPRRVAGDQRDVVDPLELHLPPFEFSEP